MTLDTINSELYKWGRNKISSVRQVVPPTGCTAPPAEPSPDGQVSQSVLCPDEVMFYDSLLHYVILGYVISYYIYIILQYIKPYYMILYF